MRSDMCPHRVALCDAVDMWYFAVKVLPRSVVFDVLIITSRQYHPDSSIPHATSCSAQDLSCRAGRLRRVSSVVSMVVSKREE